MPLEVSRIQALCFDVDGTLRDTDDQYVQRLARWLHPLRFLFHRRDAHAVARRLVMRLETPANFAYSLPDRLGIDDKMARLGIWMRKPSPEKSHRFSLVQGTAQSLEALSRRFPMAVVTARGHHATQAFLQHFHLSPYFRCVASALTSRRTKPHPGPILWAAAQLEVPPEACLMVGDTTVDMIAARAAGAQTVGVLSGFGQREELIASGADLILPSVADLPAFLL